MKVALITGVTGFLGHHFAVTLLNRRVEVVDMARNTGKSESIEGAISDDITDRVFVTQYEEHLSHLYPMDELVFKLKVIK